MNDFLDRVGQLSPKRLALLALELKEQVDAQRSPIAVVGIGCRFPGGADSPDAYWSLLEQGRDVTRPLPRDRWNSEAWYDPDPTVPGRIGARHGGYLDEIFDFDPAFFGISPREAVTMDPQQRLLLEVAWEALEDAGIAPERLAGTPTGVFVGLCNNDHMYRVLGQGRDRLDAYVASGNAPSVAAGRISYVLGFRGPALTVDTACSSSLVSLHLACRSLRSGESRVALAAGVNVICTPEPSVALTKSQMLAPDGRCKTFDAAADGFARGEGCGVLVLKRLEDAEADGDRILAVIRGTAINQDGRSGGLTVPNGPAQEAVIRAALADAGVDPAEVDYIEAHGTGTVLGDPIEIRAIGASLGKGRDRNRPVLVGSVKTNMGHLESAAGVAGVIKTVLALAHERIPSHLHFKTPNPHIEWGSIPVEVVAAGRAWPRTERPRYAGVSSFGFSGTNAHIVIGEAPSDSAARGPAAERIVVPVSGQSEQALRRLARSYRDVLDDEVSAADLARTAALGRSHLTHRAAVVVSGDAEARSALEHLAAGTPDARIALGQAIPGQMLEPVFLFTGQGSQYPGMAKAVYDASPVFREVIDRADQLLGPDRLGRTLKAVLWSDASAASESAPIHETDWTQPALFAVEYGFAALWQSWGIVPAAVIGHSVGEYVAACVAGVFSFEDGLRLIAERGRIMHALPPGGTMAAVFAPQSMVTEVIQPWRDRLAIAAVNADDSVVISGATDAVDAALAALQARQVEGHRLYISLAAHSPLTEPILDAMEGAAAKVPMVAPRIPVAWNLTGGALGAGAVPDARYWRRHLRESVRFADGLRWLYGQGFRTFLEVGPHPTLTALAARTLPESDTLLVGSIRRGKDDWTELYTSLATLYARGGRIDWEAVSASWGGHRVRMPTYPFERRRFAVASPTGSRNDGETVSLGALPPFRRLDTPDPIIEFRLTPDTPAWLGDHRVFGRIIAPGPLLIEAAQIAHVAVYGKAAGAVERFVIRGALEVGDEGVSLQVGLTEAGDHTSFRIHAKAAGRDAWQLIGEGQLRSAASTAEPTTAPLGAVQSTATGADFYDRLRSLGIDLGPAFQGLTAIRRMEHGAIVDLDLPFDAERAAGGGHPTQLDAVLQAVGAALDTGSSEAALLVGVDRIALTGPLPRQLRCLVQVRPQPDADTWRADVALESPSGAHCGVVEGVTLRRASPAAPSSAAEQLGFYRVAWHPVAGAAELPDPKGVVGPLLNGFGARAERHGLRSYDQVLPRLDQLSLHYILTALTELGFDDTPGRVVQLRRECDQLRIAPQHDRLFDRLLDILEEEGYLVSQAGARSVARRLPETGSLEPWPTATGWPDGEYRVLARCGPSLARVLRGEVDPLHLLFPGGSFAEARTLYVESAFAQTYNGVVADAVRRLAEASPDRPLRILEIGAGTGGTTTYVLPALPSGPVDYTFTDVSPLFLERAQEAFGERPGFQTALLDIERDPAEQGFETGSYDLVIAANVLHATADLARAVEHARSLLRPGGWLSLIEGVAPERWVDLTFGLTDGWWRFTDRELRARYPLVSVAQWETVLRDRGFASSMAVPGPDATSRAARQQAILFAQARPNAASRAWTVVGARTELVDRLSARLTARGDTVTVLGADTDPTAWTAAGGDLIYLDALALVGTPSTPDAVSVEQRAGVLPLRWLARATLLGANRVWFVTSGTQAVRAAADVVNPSQAPIWGLGRAFALEEPERWGGEIDLASESSAEEAALQIVTAIAAEDGEDQTAWRDGRRYMARLERVPEPEASPVRVDRSGAYLVTGGFGGLGLLVGRWLAEQGAGVVALLGRNPDLSLDGVRAIEALGTRVVGIRGDVSDPAAVAEAISRFGADLPQLRGIVHTAAALSTGRVGDLDEATIVAMYRAKVAGTLALADALRGRPLDFAVLFSSSTALLGAGGFAHYAGANQFLDAYAQSQTSSPAHWVAIDWGTWEVMRLASADAQRDYRRSGLLPMRAEAALDAMARLAGQGDPQTMVASIDWSVLRPLHEARRTRPLLAALVTRAVAPTPGTRTAVSARVSLEDQLNLAQGLSRRDVILRFVSGEVAGVLGLEAGAFVSPAVGLFELGMDSLMSVELKRRLEQGTGRTLPSTLTFNYPNVGALTGFLEQLFPEQAPDPIANPSNRVGQSGPPESQPDANEDVDDIAARLRAALEDIG